MEEEWRDIEGYEGRYQVSNLGRIRSFKGQYSKNKIIILKLCINNRGYSVVSLSKNNKHKSYKVHRLVAQAFIPKIDNKSQINHINGNKQDNRVSNLEWCTYSENMYHAWETGLNKGVTGQRFSEEHKKNISKSIRKNQKQSI